jgi:hypothetical protein
MAQTCAGRGNGSCLSASGYGTANASVDGDVEMPSDDGHESATENGDDATNIVKPVSFSSKIQTHLSAFFFGLPMVTMSTTSAAAPWIAIK